MSTLADPTVGTPPLRVRALADGDRDDLVRLVDADPLVNAVLASRLRAIGTLAARTFGGTTYGTRSAGGVLSAAAFSGGNLLPVGGGPDDWHALGRRLAGEPRSCSSMVGRADAVEALWRRLAPAWGPARIVRAAQPLLVFDARSDDVAGLPVGDARVRLVRIDETQAYLPAAEAMFTEELEASPYEVGRPGDYRRRINGLVRQGRALCIVDRAGSVLFKADVGAVSEQTCQLQGVWVRPDLRGRGIGTAAMPAVLRHALTLAPSVSLYVNDFNVAARRMYARLGMRQAAVLSTVLF